MLDTENDFNYKNPSVRISIKGKKTKVLSEICFTIGLWRVNGEEESAKNVHKKKMMSDGINHLVSTIIPNQDNFSSLLFTSNSSSSSNNIYSKMIQDEDTENNFHERQDDMIWYYQYSIDLKDIATFNILF